MCTAAMICDANILAKLVFINDVTDNDSVIEITNRHTSYCSHVVTIVKT